jgi:hypothetical protein
VVGQGLCSFGPIEMAILYEDLVSCRAWSIEGHSLEEGILRFLYLDGLESSVSRVVVLFLQVAESSSISAS